MTVQQLIELLEQYDPTADVIVAIDPEGNGFAPVEETSEGFFNSRRSEYYGVDLSETDFNEYDDENDDEESDIPKGSSPAICLWPAY